MKTGALKSTLKNVLLSIYNAGAETVIFKISYGSLSKPQTSGGAVKFPACPKTRTISIFYIELKCENLDSI